MKYLLILLISLSIVSCGRDPYNLKNYNYTTSTVYSLDSISHYSKYGSYESYYIKLFVLTTGIIVRSEIDHHTYNLLNEKDTINIIYSKTTDYKGSESHFLYRTKIAGTIRDYNCFYNSNFDETYKIHKDSLNNYLTFILY